MSSGSDPHLMALLRAIRLRAAAPEAFAAGEADVAAALGDSGTPGARSATPMPGPPHAALPPPAPRLGLPAAPAESAATAPAEPAPEAPPERPANPDPFAQSSRSELPAGHPADPPRTANPLQTQPPGSVPANHRDATASIAPEPPHTPYAPPTIVPGRAPTPGPSPAPGSPPAPGPAAPAPFGYGSRLPGVPIAPPPPNGVAVPLSQGIAVPAVPEDAAPEDAPPVPPPWTAGRPLPSPPFPPAGTPVGTGAGMPPGVPSAPIPGITPPPGGLPVPPATSRPPAPAAPQPPAGPSTAPGPGNTNPGALVPHEVPGDAVPWTASAIRPVHGPTPHHGGAISTGPVSVDPVPGLSAVGRPVPGQYPEPVTPVPHAAPLPGVPKVGTTAPAADGMNPADDAALREVQRLLSNSLTIAGGADEVALRLRAALMLARPELMAALPGSPQWQREQLAQALTWLVHNLDDPPALVAGCVQLGGALAECGVQPQQLTLIGAALAEAMRAGMAANGWRQDFDQAWRSTWQHVHEWMSHGADVARYEPVTWLAEVVSHELRRPDLAVVRFRPYLPMPFRPGQYARIEVSGLPGVWRPYSLAGAPHRDNVVELHVRAKTEAGVSGTLVYRTKAGDRVRFTRAEGHMRLPEGSRDLLLVAGDTGVAPLKAMLTELAATGDRRNAVLFWGVRDLDELYDIEEIASIARACQRATVVPVVSVGEAGQYASGLVTDAIAAYGEWSDAEVFLAGPPLMLAATREALQALGVAPERIHHDAPEG